MRLPARALLLLLAAALSSSAAVVRLKDGAAIEGTVIRTTQSEVLIRTPSGERSIPPALVSSIEYDAAPAPAPVPYQRIGAGDPPDRRSEADNSFGLALGFVVPQSGLTLSPDFGGTANNGDIGGMIGARYLRESTPNFGWGADFEYFHRGGTFSGGLVPMADSSVSGDNLTFLGIARYRFVDHGAVRPYVLGGLGFGRTWTRVDVQPKPGFVWTDTGTDESRRAIDGGGWAPAGEAKVGLDFHWDDTGPTAWSLEAGWTGVGRTKASATSSGRRDLGLQEASGRVDVFSLAMRWSWEW